MKNLQLLSLAGAMLVPVVAAAAQEMPLAVANQVLQSVGPVAANHKAHRTLINNLSAFYPNDYGVPISGFAASNNGAVLAIGGSFMNASSYSMMTPDAAEGVKAEIFQSIDFSKLIKLSYGAGGQRRVILWSAIDCPSCARFEEWMIRSNPDATFYLVPTALDRSDAKKRALVTNIWCSIDAAGAWRNWMLRRQEPRGPFRPSCDVNYDAGEGFAMAMTSAGAQLYGTPAFILESGEVRNRWANDQVESGRNLFLRKLDGRRLSGLHPEDIATGFQSLKR